MPGCPWPDCNTWTVAPDEPTEIQPPGPGRQWHVPDPAGGGSGPTPDPPESGAEAGGAPVVPPPATPPAQPQQPRPQPQYPVPQKPARKKRRWLRWTLIGMAVLLALLFVYLFWLWRSYSGINRVDLDDVLDPVAGDATNYLLVGSDSRENLDPEAPNAAEPTVAGRRADTIILLQISPEATVMMSVPRDLWVTDPATGRDGRINGTYNDGPANLVAAVQQNLGVPVNHYAEVDFASFAGLIDAVGGITIEFEHPAFDTESGLNIITGGPVTLDGTAALAYVRSRNYTEVIDGQEVKDPTADLGRQERQREFLVTALGEVGGERNPIALARAAAALSGGLTVDSSLGFFEALGFARRLGGSTPETLVLPTRGARIGGASVLLLDEDEAQPVLDRFR
jgi:LCP family protein required for cell wall assembly